MPAMYIYPGADSRRLVEEELSFLVTADISADQLACAITEYLESRLSWDVAAGQLNLSQRNNEDRLHVKRAWELLEAYIRSAMADIRTTLPNEHAIVFDKFNADHSLTFASFNRNLQSP